RPSHEAGPAGSAAGLELGLHLGAASLVDDLAPHGIAGVGEPIAGRRQRAAHAMRTFADHHLDCLGALAEDGDLDLLAGAGDPNFDFFGGNHYAASRARSIASTMSGEFGVAKSSPWQTRQPASARNSRCACVSTPLAMTSKFMPRASAISALARPARSVSCGMPAISLRSIQTALARRRC